MFVPNKYHKVRISNHFEMETEMVFKVCSVFNTNETSK